MVALVGEVEAVPVGAVLAVPEALGIPRQLLHLKVTLALAERLTMAVAEVAEAMPGQGLGVM